MTDAVSEPLPRPVVEPTSRFVADEEGANDDRGRESARRAEGGGDATRRSSRLDARFVGVAGRGANVLASIHPAAWLTGAGAVIFAVVFGRLGVRSHNAFGTWSFDMGIYDQAYWLASRFGDTFVTVRGLEFWGHHVNLVAYLYAPFYWLGAGPSFLYVSQASVIGLGAVPVYLIARDRFRAPWYGFAFAVAYLLYAPIQWISWANYHPEALVFTPLLFAWWCARRGYWKAYFVALLLALSTREDTALAVAVLGVVLMVIYRPRRVDWRESGWRAFDWRNRAWRNACLTLLLGGAWYAFCTKLLIPHYNPTDSPWYVQAFFSEYGTTTGEVVGKLVRHPNIVVEKAILPDRLRFYRDLFLPLGGLPLLGLPFLAMAGPQMLASVIGSSPYARQILYQYTSVMIAPIMIAAIEGFAVIWRRRSLRQWGVVWLLSTAVVSNIAWSPSPIGDRYRVWSEPLPRHEVLKQAISLVPKNARLVATYSLLPHLSHRRYIYDWPNPFQQAYWGNMDNRAARLPDPAFVDYLALDRNHISPEMQPFVDGLVAPGGEFEKVLDVQNVLVARRVRPPAIFNPVPAGGRPVRDVLGPPPGSTPVTAAPPPAALNTVAPPSVVLTVAPRPGGTGT